MLKMLVDSMAFGDQLVLIDVHQAGVSDSDARRYKVDFPRQPEGKPNSLEIAELNDTRDAVRLIIDGLFESRNNAVMRTDLFSTLHIASAYTRDRNGRSANLIIFSDMEQSDGTIEMAKGIMPDTIWLNTQREKGLLPQLAGACVRVAGADVTAKYGTAIKDFWIRFFQAADAVLNPEDYRFIWPSGVPRRC